jgi:hypothetical protein
MGGYSPLRHFSSEKYGGFKTDESGNSFLFSLSENEKFKLTDKKNAICCFSNHDRISFGQSDQFQIFDKANKFDLNFFKLKEKTYLN